MTMVLYNGDLIDVSPYTDEFAYPGQNLWADEDGALYRAVLVGEGVELVAEAGSAISLEARLAKRDAAHVNDYSEAKGYIEAELAEPHDHIAGVFLDPVGEDGGVQRAARCDSGHIVGLDTGAAYQLNEAGRAVPV
jgi:hypothetical protein